MNHKSCAPPAAASRGPVSQVRVTQSQSPRAPVSGTRVSRGPKLNGFTLLELLIVIGIIGVISALGFNTLATYRQTQRLNQSRSEVVVALERARQYTRRYNVTYTVKFNTDGTYVSSASDAAGAALTQLAGPPITVLPQVSGKISSDMTFTTNADGTAKNLVVFQAPFGRLNATSKGCVGLTLTIGSKKLGTETHVLSATGKVMPRVINQNQTAALCP
jgi:prepilin-type N-terminal cleavage/methylation domain-containing protein